MWADPEDEARSPYQLWGHVDEEDLPVVPPPRTLQVLATPTKRILGQRGHPPQDGKWLEAAGFSTSSSSNTRGSENSGRLHGKEDFAEYRAGYKADHGDLHDLRGSQAQSETYGGFKVESGDLRALRNFKGQTPAELADAGGNLKFRNNQSSSFSVVSSPDANSVSQEGWSKKPKDAVYGALRYLGLVNNKRNPAQSGQKSEARDSVGPFLEFALSICFASAVECKALAMAATEEERHALQKLRALAERHHLLGRGVVMSSDNDATLSPADLVFAFLEASATRQHGFGRKESSSSMMSRGRSYSRVRFDSTPSPPDSRSGDVRHVNSPPRQESELSNVIQAGQYLTNLPRQDSNASSIQSAISMNILNRRTGFGRSQSDFSATSFADFNRKQGQIPSPAEVGGKAATAATETSAPDAAPAFVEFLIFTLKGQELNQGPLLEPRNKGGGGTDFVLDLKLNNEFARSNPDDDLASALTYHSYCDALFGSNGEEKEPISAEIAKVDGLEGKQTIRVLFNSKCLRTHNTWQAHLLAQQRALLDVVAGKLKAAEKSLKADEEVKEEERELLRGFRKIVRREQGADDLQAPVEIFVVEQKEKLREEAKQLCQILSYPCEDFNSLKKATNAIAEASKRTVGRVVSMISQRSANAGGTQNTLPELLESRPGRGLNDWRCRALCTTGRNDGKSLLETPTQVVLLGMTWLTRGLQLPEDWLQQGVFVVLITEAGDFEDVGRELEASGEGEIREKLRAKGISDYLIHPLSLDSLSAVISHAEERRLEEYLLLDILGRGATACVHKAKRLKDNETLALKEINMRRLSRAAKEEIDRELRLLRELSWPSIVFTLDAWENEKEKLRYVVMPLLEGGSLLTRIEAARIGGKGEEGYSVDRVADWFVQTIHGLSYLHWRGVIHRDVKPGNLLIGQDNRLLQIGDLGSAMLLPGTGPFPNPHAKVVAPVTSPAYASPEALLQDTHLAASDIWCVGASFFEVLTLHPLFPEVQSMAEAKEHVRAFDPSMAAPTGATNYALAALSTLNQIRCSSTSSAAAVELAGSLPELVRPDFMQRPTAASIALRYFCMKRVKTLLKETGAVPKGNLSSHIEDYKTLLKQSQAAKSTAPDAAGVSPVDSPVAHGRGPRHPRTL